jgi:hypothetical protein
MDASALKSAAKALESAIKALESRSDSLEDWLKFWICLVVAGVVIEVFVVLVEYRHALEEFRRATIRTPDRPSGWMVVFGLLGAGLVAIGVSGELGIDFMSRDVETGLRNKNRELVGLFQRASSEAIERASNADERASANEREAAELRKVAEGERLERMRLEVAIQPRTLTLKQQQDMTNACLQFAGSQLEAFSQVGDAEGARLVMQIVAALRKAQIPAQGRAGGIETVNDVPPSGVSISSFNPGLSKAIADSLTAAKIASTVRPPRPNEHWTILEVGIKPFELLK